MPIYEIGKYHISKKKYKELKEYTEVLDKIAKLLYDNLEYSESWQALFIIEDAMVKYRTIIYEHELIIKNKGKKEDEL